MFCSDAEILAMWTQDPVATVTGNAFPSKGRHGELVAAVAQKLAAPREVKHPNLGVVHLTRQGIKSSVAHGLSRLKVECFEALPEVLANGVLVAVETKDVHVEAAFLAAKVVIRGIECVTVALVKRNESGNWYYLHEVTFADGTRSMGPALKRQMPREPSMTCSGSLVETNQLANQGKHGAMRSILQRIFSVKN